MLRRINTQSRDDVSSTEIKRVIFIGDYLPRKCGIATFTFDLHTAVKDTFTNIRTGVVAVNDIPEGYQYDSSVRFEIDEQDPIGYLRAIDYIHGSGASVVCLQHEYGIYGGPCGVMLLSLLRGLKIPIISTLHTILEEPSHEQRHIMKTIIQLSSRVITMAEVGRKMLVNTYKADYNKIALIPHGIPEMEYPDTEAHKKELGFTGHKVVLTFGLLSPNKGIEFALRAVAQVVKDVPDVLYVVLGQTHPGLIREHGEAYRNSLEWLCKELNITNNVRFVNSFVDMPLLKTYIAACDVYLTPYLHEQQITSGTLSYAYGMGTAVVSTPYWHAAELLADGRGRLVPFREPEPMGRELLQLLTNEGDRIKMKKDAFEHGRSMTWSNTARLYMRTFEEGLYNNLATPFKGLEESTLPLFKPEHLLRMTDSTGIIQHGKFLLPDWNHGYCVDDNCRALQVCAELRRTNLHYFIQVEPQASIYAAYVSYSYSTDSKKFRNFMSYNRRWLDETGTDDSNGRTLRAIACCVRAGLFDEWATELFSRAVKDFTGLGSIRAVAQVLIAFSEFFQRYTGPGEFPDLRQQRDEYCNILMTELKKFRKENWIWFEDKATYENAVLPQALIVTGRDTNNQEMLTAGLESLDWLMDNQLSEEGYFSPVGNLGWFPYGGKKADYDQQPIEAGASVLACLAAYDITKEEKWSAYAYTAFQWFLGGNILGISLYNPATGGVLDGLEPAKGNANEGAESILLFHLSLAALEGAGITRGGPLAKAMQKRVE